MGISTLYTFSIEKKAKQYVKINYIMLEENKVNNRQKILNSLFSTLRKSLRKNNHTCWNITLTIQLVLKFIWIA